MKPLIIKDYILSKTKISKDNPSLNLEYESLKLFFQSISSVIYENNLWILLLDYKGRILEISSMDGKDHTDLYNRMFDSSINSNEEEYLIENLNGREIHLLLSPLVYNNVEEIKYRFAFVSLDKGKDLLRKLSNNLNNSLETLVDYHNNKFKDSNNLFNYLDAVDDGISACDANGVITYINKSGLNILKAKEEDILNQKLESLTSEPMLRRVLVNEKTYQDLEYFIDYKNRNAHLITSAYPVYDKTNNLIGAIDIFRRIKRSIKIATDLAGNEASYTFDDFVGNSETLNNTIELAKQFSHSNKNILIIGESGTGKELFAQSIHNYSTRRNNPFVAINCASYPKDLFDSELFGYEEGTFTGAKKGGKIGKFELADGGTLLLDEIGEMPLHLQAKLLRVIETKSITRIGSNKKVNVNVRIIAATNRNLEEMTKNNSFRKDLYYRLKVLYLYIEPLRARGEDSVLLCNYFIQKFSQDSHKPIKGLDEEATELVKSYKWPGNIRELENVVSLSLFYYKGDYITKDNMIQAGLKDMEEANSNNLNIPTTLSQVTKDIILKTLEKNNGNKKKTAEELGISRNTIYRLLSK